MFKNGLLATLVAPHDADDVRLHCAYVVGDGVRALHVRDSGRVRDPDVAHVQSRAPSDEGEDQYPGEEVQSHAEAEGYNRRHFKSSEIL